MSRRKIAVVGGGAAGIVAALTAAKQGAEVTVFERNDRIGKKILATGNGKCNLSNRAMTPDCFHTRDPRKLRHCLEQFGVEETVAFFEGLGLMIKDKNGYLYPAAEQAAVVLDVLRIALAKSRIRVVTEARVTAVTPVGNEKKSEERQSSEHGGKDRMLQVTCNGQRESFDRVIIACGSKAAPKTGSDGNGYDLAKSLGHRLVEVVPSLVQLRCSDSFCKALAGIRAEACVHIYEQGRGTGPEKGQDRKAGNRERADGGSGRELCRECADGGSGRELCRELGEVQLTEYGISGIPVFQLSETVNRRLQAPKHGALTAVVDFLPGMDTEEVEQMARERQKMLGQGVTVEEFFTGMLNKKLMLQLIKAAGLNPAAPVEKVPAAQLKKVFHLCKGLEFHIAGHNGFENAQVCGGGVDLREVTQDMESLKVPGVFFAGEILDVDGRCGGYNLQWAWTSGWLAGKGVMK